jgi:4-aminobutyrate aminotransferase / (S)-3-amino-2-methylpropionate transaminase / 5-aminovalerate transaminase
MVLQVGKFARIKTAIPGPKSIAIVERKEKYVSAAFKTLAPIVIDRGEGATIVDVDGNEFIDFTGGIGCLNVGHHNSRVTKALHEQIDRFLHTDFTVIPYESLVDLAERLVKVTPVEDPAKGAFFNSGAEAVENAVKIARAYSGRMAMVAFEGAFHGRTMMAMSLTSKLNPYRKGFGPFAPEVYRVPYAYCYRCPVKSSYPACGLECAGLLERSFKLFVDPEETAAVIIESVQGEGGFVVPPKDYLGKIAEICKKNDVLLIVDEVQTGFGRTGKMFACEHSGVKPDIITMAKSIAAGIPLSAVVGRAKVMDGPGDSRIGGTFVGNPVGCVAALEVLKLMEELRLPEKAETLGKVVKARLNEMKEKHPIIGDVRGLGMMVAMELVKDQKTKEPAPQEAAEVIQRAMQKGVIPLKCGMYGNVVRMLPSLVIGEEQMAEGLDLMAQSLGEVEDNLGIKHG